MTPEEKKKIREMKLHSPGWQTLEKWAKKQIDNHTKLLIEENDETIRGTIKGMKAFLNKVNQLSKPKEE